MVFGSQKSVQTAPLEKAKRIVTSAYSPLFHRKYELIQTSLTDVLESALNDQSFPLNLSQVQDVFSILDTRRFFPHRKGTLLVANKWLAIGYVSHDTSSEIPATFFAYRNQNRLGLIANNQHELRGFHTEFDFPKCVHPRMFSKPRELSTYVCVLACGRFDYK
ncbi:MAG: hypothetical protein ACMXYF_01020 [Candidatus Woesearchaeota archaeon]